MTNEMLPHLSLPTIVAEEQLKDRGRVKNGASLSELVAASSAWDADIAEMPLHREELRFTEEGLLHEGQVLEVDEDCRMRLLDKVQAPVSYLKKHSPSFQLAALSEHAKALSKDAKLRNFGTRPTAVVQNGKLVTIARGDLINLPNSAVLKAVGEQLGSESSVLFVARVRHHPEWMEVELVSPSKATVVRAGDIVQAGLSIIHSRYGNQATQIYSFAYRLICKNGLLRKECVSRDGGTRTRKLSVDLPDGRGTQLKQIRRLTEHTWKELQAQLEALRETSEQPADVPKVLQQWLEKARISWLQMRERLLEAWEKDGEEATIYGAVNAITNVATHSRGLSDRQRHVLASLAGLRAFSKVHICPLCLNEVADSPR